MRVVLDANVLLAALLTRGTQAAGSPDPDDDFLLATAQAAGAEFLATGDKSGLLALKKHGVTTIPTARALLDLLE